MQHSLFVFILVVVVVLIYFFYFHPYFGEMIQFDYIILFQMGWKHQLVMNWVDVCYGFMVSNETGNILKKSQQINS